LIHFYKRVQDVSNTAREGLSGNWSM